MKNKEYVSPEISEIQCTSFQVICASDKRGMMTEDYEYETLSFD